MMNVAYSFCEQIDSVTTETVQTLKNKGKLVSGENDTGIVIWID
jgi:hypothetical protein